MRDRRESFGVTRENLELLFRNEKILVLKKENVKTFSNFNDNDIDQGETFIYTYLIIYL
jgi:hypothetical protein